MIHYHVEIITDQPHTLRVEMTFQAKSPNPTISIPAWTPGSYLIREFSRYFGEMSCINETNNAIVAKTAKGTWRAEKVKPDSSVTFRFTIYANEISPRNPHVDNSHAFFLGVNILPFVEGRKEENCKLTINSPKKWTTFCALEEKQGAFFAEDYDILADTAVEIGPHNFLEFSVLGVPHRAIFWGDRVVKIDKTSLVEDIIKIAETNATLFGNELPYKQYDFLFHITPTLRGGLEHLSGTTLLTPWSYFETEKGFNQMLTLITHEHFHVWNAKRIRPHVLGPFDYLNENYTRALWVVEGLTSYYDELLCVRSNLMTRKTYLDLLAESLTKLDAVRGRHVQSLAESSFDAWIRLYRPDENTVNRTVSYYLKGAIVCTMLDLKIRHISKGTSSLDDFLADLWREFQETGAGYQENSLFQRIVETTGVDVMSDLLEWIEGTDDPDYERFLATHGLTLTREEPSGIDFGAIINDLRVVSVDPNGPAAKADLNVGDRLVAINGREILKSDLAKQLAHLRAETPVTVHFFRRQEIFQTTIIPKNAGPGAYKIQIIENLSAEQEALLNAWLPENLERK